MNVIQLAMNGILAESLSFYGDYDAHLPCFDQLALDGWVFDRCFAPNPAPPFIRRLWWQGYGPNQALETQDFPLKSKANSLLLRTTDLSAPDQYFCNVQVEPDSPDGIRRCLQRAGRMIEEAEPDWLLAIDVQLPHSSRAIALEEPGDVASAMIQDSLADLDARFGTLLDLVERTGAADQTVVILTGNPALSGTPALQQRNIHVPLVIRTPCSSERFCRCSALVQPNDVFASVLEVLGIPPPEGDSSCSLIAIMRGQKQLVREYILLEASNEIAVRTQSWYFRIIQGRRPELFAKPEDRWDHNDMAAEFPEITGQFEALLDQVRGAKPGQTPAELPAELK